MRGELGQWNASKVEASAESFPGSQPRAPLFFSASGPVIALRFKIYVLLCSKEISLEKFTSRLKYLD